MPFRDREGSSGPVAGGLLGRPVPWIVLLLLLGALALAFWPANKTVVEPAPVPSAAPAESIALPPPTPAASDVDAVAAPAEDAGASAPSAVASAAEAGADTVAPSASAPALVSAGPLVLRASAPSWIQVSGGDGRTLLSRTLEKDETVSLDGALPMRLIIGNAAATEVVLRGVPVDLAPHTRENIARFELP
jgi:cytoskeleton protein RodZ